MTAPLLPESMRAWQITAHGEPREVMHLADVPTPSPSPSEVLIRVRAVAVNFPDVLLARGEYQVRPDLPFTPGIELCGDVVAVGEQVRHVGVGDRVVASHIGSLAEYTSVPAGDVRVAPAGLDDTQAAGLTIAYQTAWFALHRRARLQRGETLLVHAAAGGVGLAAVQLGVAAGARVIGVVGSPEKAEAARAAGATHVLVRPEVGDGLAQRVKDLTDGDGADVVFDPVGGSAFDASTKCIAFEGRIVIVGFASGEIPAARMNHALVKNYSLLGLHWALYQQRLPELADQAHAELVRLAEAGEIQPVVDDVVAFADAPSAIERLAAGSTVGRVVITIAE
ncbi:NADPH:quinone oxidoreductase family protein [Microbacterium sp. G2-8]|uniref:NADPH:quinone oxidoreductase family protein n=1 Tax=Microbacterium sp. G2-8 TaxID=2842454 RepID=UPI0027E33AF8|nr:NADPH:quinone oxidoreductase family protein [Microbacterium sp. G2-8]